jgi:hypothetical protein
MTTSSLNPITPDKKAKAMAAAFRPFTYLELLQKYGRAELGVDGNCGFALLGGDLQEGEAEFVEIEYNESKSYICELAACKKALQKLRDRLGMSKLSFYFGPSHPYGD